ncbi:unnamed protein product [Blepharisma stoltei]|uniref:non-specific serine/threonine protein kinase n=1 Tax=Blepharisma stoltei TaxID=1481888 RepID=A0AAU9IW57_9CILI|nr:unnamed protein product [Blepharisma stoltei]
MGCCTSTKNKVNSSIKITSSRDIFTEQGIFVQLNRNTVEDVYEFGKSLGHGAYGEVRVVTRKGTNIERAVKIIPKEGDFQTKEFLNEVKMMKILGHPNTVQIYEYFDSPKKCYLVMELCKGGELLDELIERNHFHEYDAVLVMKQVFSAVSYLHSRNIIHRDLKPQNILLESKGNTSHIKISDFGAAMIYENNHNVSGIIGTPFFLAPEVIKGRYTSKCDLWSCGVILYLLLSGSFPFSGNSNNEIFKSILNGHYSFSGPQWLYISADAKDLISKLLCPEKSRLSAKDCLEHPWIVKRSRPYGDSDGTENVLINLRAYQCKSKLKSAIQMYIASQIASAEEISKLKEVFIAIDTNGDGKISKDELRNKCLSIMKESGTEGEVDKIMNEVDTDKNGFIDYNEFLRAALDKRLMNSRENLAAAFNMFDKDNSGAISADELRSVLGEGLDTTDNVWTEILDEADSNGNGEIDIKEFEALVMSKLW